MKENYTDRIFSFISICSTIIFGIITLKSTNDNKIITVLLIIFAIIAIISTFFVLFPKLKTKLFGVQKDLLYFQLNKIFKSQMHDFPVTMYCKDYEQYKTIAIRLSKYSSNFLIWTLVGSPTNVYSWEDNPEKLTSTDIDFAKFKSKNKNRVVIFANETELNNFAQIGTHSNEYDRIKAFEKKARQNNGNVYYTVKTRFCNIYCKNRCSQEYMDSVDFEFGYIYPNHINFFNRLINSCKNLLSNDDTLKKIEKYSIAFETGYKSGNANSVSHRNHLTFYPYNDGVEKIKKNDLGFVNPNYENKYKYMIGDITCHRKLVELILNNEVLIQNSTNNFKEFQNSIDNKIFYKPIL